MGDSAFSHHPDSHHSLCITMESIYGQQSFLCPGGSSALSHLMSHGRPPECKLSIAIASQRSQLSLAEPSLSEAALHIPDLPSLDRQLSMPAECPCPLKCPSDCLDHRMDKIKPKYAEVDLDGSVEMWLCMDGALDMKGIAENEGKNDRLARINGVKASIGNAKHRHKSGNINKNIRSQERANAFREHTWQGLQKQVIESEGHMEQNTIDGGVLSLEGSGSSTTLDLIPGPPSIQKYISIMQVCRIKKDQMLARQVHAQICSNGLQSNDDLGNYIVPMFVDCGIMSSARQVFDRLVHKNEHSWTSLITGHIRCGQPHQAFDVYQQMQEAYVHPSSYTLVTLLNSCAELKNFEKGWEVHAKIAQEEFERDLFVGNALVDMYGKCGSLVEAREVLDKMLDRDIVSWNAIIAGYAEHGPSHEALACFELMQSEGLSPNATTLACILKACSSAETVDKGQKMHMEITYKGFSRDLLLDTCLVGMYAKCGLLSEAQEVFNKLLVHDVVAWTALISGYADHGPGEEAIDCFEKMQVEGVSPNTVTFACILKACSNGSSALSKGQEVHIEVTQKGLEKDLLAGNTLIGMYAKFGLLQEAQDVFDKLLVQDVVSWNALITGYAEHEHDQQALRCFDQMQLEGISPDSMTYASVLKSCGNFGAAGKGREVHMDITGKGFEGQASVGNSLISMYANCGLLSEAEEVFDKLAGQDVVAWTAIMKGYAMNHEGKMAADCFEDMQKQGVKADAVTITCLLTACSHASMVVEGLEYLKVMREKYGIAPGEEHYSCMIDLLGRSGYLYEAEKVLETLCPPSDGTWAALLSACKTYGEVELGLRCFQELLKMDPENAAWFVLMKDIYASAGRWDDAMMIEKLRKQAGAAKKLASALIEVNKNVHEFVVGDCQTKELSSKLKSLSSRIKDEGCMPNLDVVLKPVSDEEKEASICEHAERLAIAFGLIHTPHGQTLHITKNLRMCNDCHNAGKIISRIERREIILRDECCIHHFKDGLCLCKDMF